MNLETVEHWWLGFSTSVLHPDAGEVQHQEMRRAFYAGVWAVLTALDQTIGHQELPEERLWRQECWTFKQDVLRGKA